MTAFLVPVRDKFHAGYIGEDSRLDGPHTSASEDLRWLLPQRGDWIASLPLIPTYDPRQPTSGNTAQAIFRGLLSQTWAHLDAVRCTFVRSKSFLEHLSCSGSGAADVTDDVRPVEATGHLRGGRSHPASERLCVNFQSVCENQ